MGSSATNAKVTTSSLTSDRQGAALHSIFNSRRRRCNRNHNPLNQSILDAINDVNTAEPCAILTTFKGTTWLMFIRTPYGKSSYIPLVSGTLGFRRRANKGLSGVMALPAIIIF